MFTNYMDIALEKWLDPLEFVKIYPLLYEVEAIGLIRQEDMDAASTSRYMITDAGRILLDDIISLVTVNLIRGRNVSHLIKGYNLMVSHTYGRFSFKTTAMQNELRGVENHHWAYEAAKRLIFHLLNASTGGMLLKSELPADLIDLLKLLGMAKEIDKRRITNHPAILLPQDRMNLMQRFDLVLDDEIRAFGTNQEMTNSHRDAILTKLPYLDTSDPWCFHDRHTMFEYWLDHGKKNSKKRKNNPGPVLPTQGTPSWSDLACGMALMKLHRYGVVHPFGPVSAGAAPVKYYGIKEVGNLFQFILPAYPQEALRGFCEEGIFSKLDMAGLRPHKSEYTGWDDTAQVLESIRRRQNLADPTLVGSSFCS